MVCSEQTTAVSGSAQIETVMLPVANPGSEIGSFSTILTICGINYQFMIALQVPLILLKLLLKHFYSIVRLISDIS